MLPTETDSWRQNISKKTLHWRLRELFGKERKAELCFLLFRRYFRVSRLSFVRRQPNVHHRVAVVPKLNRGHRGPVTARLWTSIGPSHLPPPLTHWSGQCQTKHSLLIFILHLPPPSRLLILQGQRKQLWGRQVCTCISCQTQFQPFVEKTKRRSELIRRQPFTFELLVRALKAPYGPIWMRATVQKWSKMENLQTKTIFLPTWKFVQWHFAF